MLKNIQAAKFYFQNGWAIYLMRDEASDEGAFKVSVYTDKGDKINVEVLDEKNVLSAIEKIGAY